MLERELSALALSDRSLKVTLVSDVSATGRRRRAAIREIQSLLGSGDAVCQLDNERLLILQTQRSGGEFVQLGAQLAGLNGAAPLKVGATVADEPMTLAELFAQLAKTPSN